MSFWRSRTLSPSSEETPVGCIVDGPEISLNPYGENVNLVKLKLGMRNCKGELLRGGLWTKDRQSFRSEMGTWGYLPVDTPGKKNWLLEGVIMDLSNGWNFGGKMKYYPEISWIVDVEEGWVESIETGVRAEGKWYYNKDVQNVIV